MGTLGSFRVKRHAQDARLVRILHTSTASLELQHVAVWVFITLPLGILLSV